MVTSANCQGGHAGCPWVGKSARKVSSVNSVSSSSATRRYRLPLGNAARATRAVSGGTGSIGIGRSMVHLHVIGRNLHDTDESYPCFKDFASSIKNDEEPGGVGHVCADGEARGEDDPRRGGGLAGVATARRRRPPAGGAPGRPLSGPGTGRP